MVAEPFALGSLFESPLGRLMYYLLMLVCLEAGWGMCYNEWRARGKQEYFSLLAAFSALLIARGVALVTDLLAGGPLAGLLGASQMLLDMAALVLLCWSFQFSLGDALPLRLYLSVNLMGIGVLYLLQLATAGLWGNAVQISSWQGCIWLVWQGVLCALAGALILRRRRSETLLQSAAFLILAAGRLAAAFFSFGGARLLSDLIAFPLLVIALYQDITGELRSIAREFQAISEPSSRQTRQLMFSLESARLAVTSLDLKTLLPRLAEIMTLALTADYSVIFLAEEADETLNWEETPAEAGPLLLRVGAIYDPLSRQAPAGRPFPPGEAPVLEQALQGRRQLHLLPGRDDETLAALERLLHKVRGGDMLIQPLALQENALGVLLVANPVGQRPFDEAQARLCEGMAGQIAAAISNARMYQSLKRQARQLANLLEAQQIENSKTRAILESIADGVVVCDVARQIMLVNRAAARWLELDDEALLGEQIGELERRLGCELALSDDVHERAFQSDPLGEAGRILRGSVALVQGTSGRQIGTVIVFRDVTNELRAEQAKSDFLATVSHELRTPLTTIKGYSELLAGGMAGDLPGPLKRFLRMIASNADRMAHLVDNILYVSEAERGIIPINPRAVDVAEVIQEAAKRAAPAFAEHSLTFEVHIEPDLPPMDVDPPRLRQVLDNLLQNAWKYTPVGGRVWVTAQRCAAHDVPAERSIRNGREYVLIAVRDTGVGIRPEDHERIFERFYRAPNPLSVEAGGTGIGLTIVKSLVEAHGGRVWVDSAENVGSTFSILLPTQRSNNGLAYQTRAA